MSLWKKLGSALRGGTPSGPQAGTRETERGLLVFHNTSEVIRAERILRAAGFGVKVMGPPPDLRSGCDMVLVFPLMLELAVRSALERERAAPAQIVPLRDLLLEPVSLFQAARSASFLMVRAANMKMTVELADGLSPRIVNISGGGCPDVPYLASLLVGKRLDQADEPRAHGRTLCAYALQKAFEETRRLLALPDLASVPEKDFGQTGSAAPLPRMVGKKMAVPRPWLICGTVPDAGFPLTLGRWKLEGERLVLEGRPDLALAVQRGTPALLASALAVCDALGLPAPQALLAGDEGSGAGSRALYRHLADDLLLSCPWEGLTFHYLFPDLDGHNRVFMALEALSGKRRPLLAADAGFMYVAKMSGYAASYDLFTPDAGELAFLADEKAPHPFYTRGFLLAGEEDVPAMAGRALAHGNSARHMLIKGAADYVMRGGEMLFKVEEPVVPALEPIGGTGDMVAGMATAWLGAGLDVPDACLAAALGARAAGAAAAPAPDAGVASLLPFIPAAVQSLRG